MKIQARKKIQEFEIRVEKGQVKGEVKIGGEKKVVDSAADLLLNQSTHNVELAKAQTKNAGVRNITLWREVKAPKKRVAKPKKEQ